MPSPTTISIDKLSRLIGTPNCPALIDVRTDEDFAAEPRLIPGSMRRPFDRVEEWAPTLGRASAIVICHQGRKLSEGVAAGSAISGSPRKRWKAAHAAWVAAGLPAVPAAALPLPGSLGQDALGDQGAAEDRPHRLPVAHPAVRRPGVPSSCSWRRRRFLASPSASAPSRSTSRACSGATVANSAPSTSWSRSSACRPSRSRRLARIVRGADTARPGPRARSAGPACRLARPVADVSGRSRPARGRDGALRRLLPMVPGRHRRDAQLAVREARSRQMSNPSCRVRQLPHAARRLRLQGRARPFPARSFPLADIRPLPALRAARMGRAGRPDRHDPARAGRRGALALERPLSTACLPSTRCCQGRRRTSFACTSACCRAAGSAGSWRGWASCCRASC